MPQLPIRLDWKAYFKRFCEEHKPEDLEPVRVGKWLLFADGWKYGLRYHGPEIPPPTDKGELQKLAYQYWTARRKFLRERIMEVSAMLEALAEFGEHRSMALQSLALDERGKPMKDEDGNRSTVELKDLKHINIAPPHEPPMYLADLEGELVRCDRELERVNGKLNEKRKERTDGNGTTDSLGAV